MGQWRIEDIRNNDEILKEAAVFIHSRLANSRYGETYQKLIGYYQSRIYSVNINHPKSAEQLRDLCALNQAFTKELRRYISETDERMREAFSQNPFATLEFDLNACADTVPKMIGYIIGNKEMVEVLSKEITENLPCYLHPKISLGRLKKGETIYDLIHRAGREIFGDKYLEEISSVFLSSAKKEGSAARIGIEAYFHKGKDRIKDANHATFILNQDSSFEPEECSGLLLKCLKEYHPADEKTYDMWIQSDMLAIGEYHKASRFNANIRVRKGFWPWSSLKQTNRVTPQKKFSDEAKFSEILDALEIPYKITEQGMLDVREKQPKGKLIALEQIALAHKLALEKGFNSVKSSVWSYPEEHFSIEEQKYQEVRPSKFNNIGRQVFLSFLRFSSARENILHAQDFASRCFDIDFNEFSWEVKEYLREGEPQELDESPFEELFD